MKKKAIASFLQSRATFFLLILCALCVGGVPIALSVLAPQMNNPVTLALCASGQFFVSIFAGIAWSKADAIREANMRWVPMAASACDRLATILGSVTNLRSTVSQACSSASRNLPELGENKNRALKIHFEGLCNSNATRLNDVESHLDSALTDWERFIKHNCNGPECADIGRRLASLRARSAEGACKTGAIGCGDANAQKAEAEIEQAQRKLDLQVTGATSDGSKNGRWSLTEVEEGFWTCDVYTLRRDSNGWFVEEKGNPDSYFFLPGKSTPRGVYERCEVCPFDGVAVVFEPATCSTSVKRASAGAVAGFESEISPQANGKNLLLLAIASNEYTQHVMQAHAVRKDTVLTALTQADDLSEFIGLLGIDCPDVVSICAIPSLNFIRDLIDRPLFEFNPALHAKNVAKTKAATGAVPHSAAGTTG